MIEPASAWASRRSRAAGAPRRNILIAMSRPGSTLAPEPPRTARREPALDHVAVDASRSAPRPRRFRDGLGDRRGFQQRGQRRVTALQLAAWSAMAARACGSPLAPANVRAPAQAAHGRMCAQCPVDGYAPRSWPSCPEAARGFRRRRRATPWRAPAAARQTWPTSGGDAAPGAARPPVGDGTRGARMPRERRYLAIALQGNATRSGAAPGPRSRESSPAKRARSPIRSPSRAGSVVLARLANRPRRWECRHRDFKNYLRDRDARS